jgi:serine phosphatase RsbU (regulator of sigma subunit)
VTDRRLLTFIKAKRLSLNDLDDEDIDLLIRLTEEARAEVERLERYRSLGQIPRLDLLLDERDQARAEVERLRAEVAEWKQAAGAEADLANERSRTITRLRGLLGRLEWVMGQWDWEACPVCRVVKAETEIHNPGCWLAAELAPNADDPPEGEQP